MLGIHKVKEMQPLMGSEDFAFYQEVIPGYMFVLGMKKERQEQFITVHSPYFEVNEDALPYGAALHASLAVRYLIDHQPNITLSENHNHDEL